MLFKKNIFLLCLVFFAFSAKGRSKKHHHKNRSLVSSLTANDLRPVHVIAKPILFSTYPGGALGPTGKEKGLFQVETLDYALFHKDNQNVALNTPFGQLDWEQIANHLEEHNGKIYAWEKNYKLELTLNLKLQRAAEHDLNQSRILNGGTVILDPRTGRILALAHSGNNSNANVLVSSRAPAASLIKIVTAAASIEKRHLRPQDEIYFRGGCSHLAQNNWIEDPLRDHQKITFAQAFGSSCNTVFARLAIYEAGLFSIRDYAEKFLFNRPIPSDIKIQTSVFSLPDAASATPLEVGEAGAGFGATKLSPIHAALLSATIGNGGVMMAPYLVEAAYNKKGVLVYQSQPTIVGRVLSKDTAYKLEDLMQATVLSGTSRRMFRRKGTRAEMEDIGGKTGTLLDPENRDILYTWFSGIAPLSSPNSIAIGTVVASSQNWVIRASSVAQVTLAGYLQSEFRSASLFDPHPVF